MLITLGCLGSDRPGDPSPAPEMTIDPGAWRGVPFQVRETSYIEYSIEPVDDAVLEVCLVDITEGPIPTTGRPSQAIGCHTSLGTEGGATIVPAGRYTLALGCMNPADPCGLGHDIKITALGEAQDDPGSI